MNKIFSLSSVIFASLIIIPLSIFSLDIKLGPLEVRAFDGGPPAEAVVIDPAHPLCFAVQNQLTLDLMTSELKENKMITTNQLFEPVLVGKNEDGDFVLVGKNPKDENLKVISLKDVQDFRVLDNMRFETTDEVRKQAAGMVDQAICG